jgi:hypothetical protein
MGAGKSAALGMYLCGYRLSKVFVIVEFEVDANTERLRPAQRRVTDGLQNNVKIERARLLTKTDRRAGCRLQLWGRVGWCKCGALDACESFVLTKDELNAAIGSAPKQQTDSTLVNI